MSAGFAKAVSGYGTKFQMGDGTANATVTVGTGGAALGATTVPVTATTRALAAGATLIFGIGKFAELTAAAASGALSLTVKPLAAALVAGDTAQGGEVYATIAEVNDLTPAQPTTATFETTHYLSPGAFQQFGVGMTDPGEVSVMFNWLPTDPTQDGITGLLKAFRDRVPRNFRMVYPFTPIVIDAFVGLVTSYPKTTPLGDRMTASVSIKVSGDIVTT